MLLVLYLLALFGSDFAVRAQNCHFDTTVTTSQSVWLIEGDEVSENTVTDGTIWDVSTQNIVGSRSSTVPHWRYLTGYRYATRYVYRATESFEEFISTERTTVILRNVTFDCSDDSSVRVHFRFPLKDENEAPEFTAYPSGNIDVNLTEVEESTIINEGILITVRDKDWTPEYNSVDVTSDRRELIITETTESPIDVGKRYDVNLKLNLTDRENIAEGVYSINLICTDGEFTDTARIKINIFK